MIDFHEHAGVTNDVAEGLQALYKITLGVTVYTICVTDCIREFGQLHLNWSGAKYLTDKY
jgi:hypothetical protein